MANIGFRKIALGLVIVMGLANACTESSPPQAVVEEPTEETTPVETESSPPQAVVEEPTEETTPVERVDYYCMIPDDGRVDCFNRAVLVGAIIDIVGLPPNLAVLADDIIAQLETANPDDNTLLSCGSGKITASAQMPNLFADQTNQLLDVELARLKEICGGAMNSIFDAGLGGNLETGYSKSVSQAVDRMNESVDKCYDTGGGIAPVEGEEAKVKINVDIQVNPKDIYEIYKDINRPDGKWEVIEKSKVNDATIVIREREYEGNDTHGHVIETIIEGTTGSGEHYKSTHTVATITQTNGPGEDVIDVVRTVVTHSNGSQTVTTVTKKNDVIVPEQTGTQEIPAPPPAPPEPPPPEEPKPEPKPEEPKLCLEENCTSTCAERKATWERFKAECERMGWRSYECKAFVAAQTGCPDPGIIMPSPDGDYRCGQTEVDLGPIRQQFCETRHGLMDPGPDGESFVCRIRDPIEGIIGLPNICNDPRAMPTEDQCVLEVPIPGPGFDPSSGTP